MGLWRRRCCPPSSGHRLEPNCPCARTLQPLRQVDKAPYGLASGGAKASVSRPLSTACLPKFGAAPWLPVHSPSGPERDGGGLSKELGAEYLCRETPRTSRILVFRTFPLHSEKEGRKEGMGEGRGSGGGEGVGEGGEERNLSTPPASTFGETERGFFIQHKTMKQKRSFFSSHNTNFSWSPGVIPRNSESRGPRWPSALRKREEGRRDPTDYRPTAWP